MSHSKLTDAAYAYIRLGPLAQIYVWTSSCREVIVSQRHSCKRWMDGNTFALQFERFSVMFIQLRQKKSKKCFPHVFSFSHVFSLSLSACTQGFLHYTCYLGHFPTDQQVKACNCRMRIVHMKAWKGNERIVQRQCGSASLLWPQGSLEGPESRLWYL